MQCPGLRSKSPVGSTDSKQCYCPENQIEMEDDDITVVASLGNMLHESIQSVSGNNSLLFTDTSISLFQLYINDAAGEITITVGPHVVFFCAQGTCRSTIIDMQGMHGIVKATCTAPAESDAESKTTFTLSWFTRREVIFANPQREWLQQALPYAETLAASKKISTGVAVFRTEKIYSQNAAVCSTCPSNLICSLL
jgi:hypothetical protein